MVRHSVWWSNMDDSIWNKSIERLIKFALKNVLKLGLSYYHGANVFV